MCPLKKIILLALIFCMAGGAADLPGARASLLQGRRGRAAVYYRDGTRHALEGRLKEAAAAFEQAVLIDPKDGDAYYSLGNVYAEQGRWADAAVAYRQTVVLKRGDGEAYNGLGVALAGLGEYEQAAAAFRSAVEIYPAWAEPRFHLSRVYKKLGRDVAARVSYSEALERRPDYATHPPRSFPAEAGAARVEPRVERARTANAPAPAAAPAPATPRSDDPAGTADARDADDTAASLYELGLSHARAGRHEEAVAALLQAVRLDRNNAAAYSALGAAYAHLGRWRESVDAHEQAVRLDPKDTYAYELLGRSYAKLRETTPAPAAPPALTSEAATGVRAATSSVASAEAPTTSERSAPAATEGPADDSTLTAARGGAPGTDAVRPGGAADAASADADPTAVYRVGPGDVLEVRVPNVQTPTTAYTVTPTGVLDYPRLGAPLKVAGLTTDEIAALLREELKRRDVVAAPQVGVTEYASHAIIVSGLVKDPGTKILRREGVPLYVIVAHAQPLPEAGRVLVVSRVTGRSTAVNLSDAAAMNMLVRPGDVLTVQALPKQFYYIAGAVRQPGQKEFHTGLTLTQALLAAGGALAPGANAGIVVVARQGGDGRLSTTRYSLSDIEAGRLPDPPVQPGDRLEVMKRD